MESPRCSVAATPPSVRSRCRRKTCSRPRCWSICAAWAWTCPGPDSPPSPRRPRLTSRRVGCSYVNVLNIHGRGPHAYGCKARRVGKTRLDRPYDPGLCGLVADRPCHLGLHHRERTDVLLERRRHDPLAGRVGADACGRNLVAALALERQSRL